MNFFNLIDGLHIEVIMFYWFF